MICLRCGYCCKYLWVIIVDNPSLGIKPDNLIEHKGQGQSCKHLEGSQPGKYRCKIHNQRWYKKTPCFTHSQIEQGNSKCRMGNYILKQAIEAGDMMKG